MCLVFCHTQGYFSCTTKLENKSSIPRLQSVFACTCNQKIKEKSDHELELNSYKLLQCEAPDLLLSYHSKHPLCIKVKILGLCFASFNTGKYTKKLLEWFSRNSTAESFFSSSLTFTVHPLSGSQKNSSHMTVFNFITSLRVFTANSNMKQILLKTTIQN